MSVVPGMKSVAVTSKLEIISQNSYLIAHLYYAIKTSLYLRALLLIIRDRLASMFT